MPAAMGDGVIIPNISSSGLPSSRSTLERVGVLKVGSASCNDVSSSRYCAGKEVGARRERLAHLDERGAQGGEFLAELVRAFLGVLLEVASSGCRR